MRQETRSAADSANVTRNSSKLDRIPLPLRMLVYAVSFLSLVLLAIPWLFYQIDVRVPAVHGEVGSWRIVGYTLAAVSLTAYLACSYVLTSRGKGPFVEFDPPKELVVEGPYRWSRNPMVTCLLGAMLGEAIGFSSTGILMMFCIVLILGHLQVTRIEEPLLRQRYGAAYEDYCRRVPRWLPRPPRD